MLLCSNQQSFQEHALGMRWQLANLAHIIISYPTHLNKVIVLLKKPQKITIFFSVHEWAVFYKSCNLTGS